MFTAAEFRAVCLSTVGLPYVLGAEATWPTFPTALDCSELVEWVLAGNGTPIVDLAAAQYDVCVGVPQGEERVGDLVFLRNNASRWNGIGHVAILTARLESGDWEIVEARGRTSGVVRTTLSYWRGRSYYAGVRRYPQFALRPDAAAPLATVTAPEIQRGDEGPAVTAWTTWLHSMFRYAARVSPGRWFGADTDAATREFQRRVGLRADGIVGPKTYAAAARLGFRAGVAL